MKAWALFPMNSRYRKTGITYRRVFGRTVCFARVLVRRVDVLLTLPPAGVALVGWATKIEKPRTGTGRTGYLPNRAYAETWIPFDRLASNRDRFRSRWAALSGCSVPELLFPSRTDAEPIARKNRETGVTGCRPQTDPRKPTDRRSAPVRPEPVNRPVADRDRSATGRTQPALSHALA